MLLKVDDFCMYLPDKMMKKVVPVDYFKKISGKGSWLRFYFDGRSKYPDQHKFDYEKICDLYFLDTQEVQELVIERLIKSLTHWVVLCNDAHMVHSWAFNKVLGRLLIREGLRDY